MRFFVHDGMTVQGPSTVEELLLRSDFDGDTLVCPVGSSESGDWKPALAYPPFRQALLSSASKPASTPPPAPIPVLRPSPTEPCPNCTHANPDGARYCNACGSRLDGMIESPAASYEVLTSSPSEPEKTFIPPDDLVSVLSPTFAPPPEATTPAEAAPIPAPVAPLPRPALAETSAWSKTLIAAFAGAVLASGGVGWWLLRPVFHPAAPVQDVKLSAPVMPQPVPAAPASAPAAPETSAPRPEVVVAPASASSPRPLPAVSARARKPRRARKPPTPAKPEGEALIESHIASREPTMPGSEEAPVAPVPAKPAAAASEQGFLLPGIPRPVAKSAVKAPAPSSKSPEQAPEAVVAPASAEAEGGAAGQVREQFDFCVQLLAQGAYADHFDTCLCAEARSSPPYRGRRGFYASELRKASGAGRLYTRAEILSVKVDGADAVVNARWRASAADAGRSAPQRWRLEDGLWCRAP